MTASTAAGKPGGRLRGAPLAAALAATVLLAVAAVQLVLAMIAPVSVEAQAERGGRQPRELAAEITFLTRTNPFAGAPEAAVAALPETEELPVTRLQLKLKGVYVDLDGDSTALIETPGGKQEVFRADETIIRGVELARVEAYRVVISRGGILESLLLENRPEIEAMAEPEATSFEAPSAPGDADGEAMLTGGRGGSRPTLASLSGNMLPLFQAQGLEGSDIPVAVDGRPLPEGGEDLRSLLPRLRSQGSLTVTVERAGELVDVELRLPPGVDF